MDNCQLNPHLSDPDAILILISKLSKKDIITKQFQVPRSDSLSPKCCCHHFSEDYQPLCPGPCSTKFHIKRELHRSTLLFSHSVSRRFLDPNKKVADGCIFFLIFSKEIERCKDYLFKKIIEFFIIKNSEKNLKFSKTINFFIKRDKFLTLFLD